MKDSKKDFELLLEDVIKEFGYDIRRKYRKREYIDILDSFVYVCCNYIKHNLSKSKVHEVIGECVNRGRVAIFHSYNKVARNDYRYKELKPFIFKIIEITPKSICNYSEENITKLIDYHTKEIDFLKSKLL